MAFISDDELNRLRSECASLQKQVTELQSDVEHERNYLIYERNKFDRLMAAKDKGIAEELNGKLRLDLDAIREIVSYLDQDDDRRRILRRLDRIDMVLEDFT